MANSLLDMKQNRQAALTQAQSIMDKMTSEGRSALNAEERAAFEGFMTQADDIKATMELSERLAAVQGNVHTDQLRSAIQVNDNHLDKPWGYEARGAETDKQRRRRIMYGFGEFLGAVKQAAIAHLTGQKGDARLYAANEQFEKRAAAAGASEMIPSDGGFLVYPDFINEVLQIAHETGIVWPKTRQLPMSEYTNAVKIPAVDEQSRKDGFRWGGVQMFWENEAQQLVGSKPTFALIELVTKKLTGLFYATNELLADQNLLGNIVMQAFGEELGFKLDDGVVRGTGAGQLLGVMNSPSLIKVAKEQGQATKTVVWENIKNMYARMFPRSLGAAEWYINQDVLPQLFGMVQVVGVGGVPVYLPPTGAAGPPYGTLMGKTINVIEQASTVGSIGDVLFMDLNQYLMIDKGDVQAATSMHVRFLTDEMTYRWIKRVDGQPWWKTALTPAQGTTTLSPFVTLDVR